MLSIVSFAGPVILDSIGCFIFSVPEVPLTPRSQMRVRGAWIQAEEGWTKRRKRDTTASSLTDHHLHSVESDDDPPSGDWSVFQQIFAEHWDVFAHAHPCSQPPSYEGRVAKMLVCGNSEQMGYVAYRCLRCGQGSHRVAMDAQRCCAYAVPKSMSTTGSAR